MNDSQENLILHALLKGDSKSVIDICEKVIEDSAKKHQANAERSIDEVRKILVEHGKEEALNFIKDIIGE